MSQDDLKKWRGSLLSMLLLRAFVAFQVVLYCAHSFAFDLGFKSDLYSETYYDSRFDGAVTDTRIYNYLQMFDERVNPYVGFHFTRDLSNDSAPVAIENAFIPTVGAEVVLLKSPYISLFTEKRQIYRTETLNGQREDDELRVGLIYYYKEFLWKKLFAETYGEWIQIDRVSTRAVFTTWLKAGYSVNLHKNYSLDPFVEGFTRQSGNIGYGPLENETRLGLRANINYYPFYTGLLFHYSLSSNINPGNYDALLVVAWRFF